MTGSQALQFLCLHQKSVKLELGAPHRSKRRGEPWETPYRAPARDVRAERAREAEEEAAPAPTAGRRPATGASRTTRPPARRPPLAQVTGWSKAKEGKPKHNAKKAMFGGWRD